MAMLVSGRVMLSKLQDLGHDIVQGWFEACGGATGHTVPASLVSWVWPPPRMPVSTRSITFLVGDSYKPSFPTVTGRGPHPR